VGVSPGVDCRAGDRCWKRVHFSGWVGKRGLGRIATHDARPTKEAEEGLIGGGLSACGLQGWRSVLEEGTLC
jgi:hypothetical protein